MRKIAVIGADGFIGRRLAMALDRAGNEVLALVFNDDCRVLSALDTKNITVRHFSFDSMSDIRADGYDTVYHMAWAGVCSSSKNDGDQQSENIIYGLKVMEWARDNGIRRIIIPGSASEVACGDRLITGSEMPAPSDLYSACKVATRFVCQTYARLNNLELIWALITSVYGPGRNDDNLITYTIRSLLKGEMPAFTKLEQQWDYIYIKDLINALICIGKKGKPGAVYPVGSGVVRQMKDYVCVIRDMIDPCLPLDIGRLPYKNKDKIDNQRLDVSKLMSDTGFRPEYSFNEGIKETIDYFREIERN